MVCSSNTFFFLSSPPHPPSMAWLLDCIAVQRGEGKEAMRKERPINVNGSMVVGVVTRGKKKKEKGWGSIIEGE